MVKDLKAIFGKGINLKLTNILRDRIYNKDRTGLLKEL
jgi:hypothetical protein